MSQLPKYLLRPDDYYVFSLNEDGETYSGHKSKNQWPDNLHHKYKYEVLIKHGFIPAVDETLHLYDELRKEYYRKQTLKYDGHGD